MTAVCALGHTRRAYECPACGEAGAAPGQAATLEHWRWYRGRTSSKRIKALIDERIAGMEKPPCGFCKGGPVGDAASWVDGEPRPPAPCPRCGETAA